MKKANKSFSILQAKAHEGEPQKLFVCIEPNGDWLEGSPHKFVGEVEVSGTVLFENDIAYVKCNIRVPIAFVCDKCATGFEKYLVADAEEEYSEIGEYESPSEFEMDYKIVSNAINLEPLVRDAVIENMPSQVLCKENCKGLCPVCGENLNFSSCKCKKS